MDFVHSAVILVDVCSIDATEEKEHIGRFINHSKKSPNLVAKVIEISGSPHIVFISKSKFNLEKN